MKYLLLLIPISLITVAQVSGKYGMMESRSIFNVFVALSFVLMFARSFIWLYILKFFDLKTAYPFLSLTYVTVLLASYLLLDEPISSTQVAGTMIIICGVMVHASGEKRT